MMHFTFAQAAISLFAALSAVPASLATSLNGRATTCNGNSQLCDKSYGNVTFVGAHDSYAVGTNNLAANQDYDVTQQLKDGIRLLQMQAHLSNNVIHLCHTSCLLYDGGTLQDYLAKVKTWMDANTNDVVTLLIVNSDGAQPSAFDSVFQAAGLTSLSYSPPSATLANTAWPKLGDMIDNGTRLVTFLDTGADFSSVPYIIDEFTNVWETAFDVTDPSFNCEVNRTKGDTSTEMYAINHFLDQNINVIASTISPDKAALNTTNAVSGTGSLGLQASQCGAQYGRSPNFMLVDFYEYGGGSVFQVAATLNGVTYAPTSAIATPVPDSSGSSSSTSSAALHAISVPRGVWAGVLTVIAGTALAAWTIL
ncbi:PLC-like phosphodiesterase [Phellopilus nigrolimitatus]|nr:PLC-like phosphodiesterase [Phellopilus nigrolimitatus]